LLRQRFGENQAAMLLRRAHFEDEGAVQAVRETKSQSAETTFDRDVSDRGEQLQAIAKLSADLCQRLAQRRLPGRTVAIKVRLDDWTTVTRARTLAAATHDHATVARVAGELLNEYAPARPVRLLGVRVAGFARPVAGAGPTPAPLDQLRLAV
jgi:DNA polymerase-4